MLQAGIAMRPAFFAYQRFWRILDYIYPPKCIGCGRSGSQWCPPCQDKVSKIEGIICERCGEPLHQPGLCQRCKSTPPSFKCLRSYGVFEGGLRDAIHSLKYNKNISMGEHLSTFLINTFAAQKWIVDLVIPVPLGASRMRERGYNQASFLAFPLALAFGLPYKPAGLCRRQETSSQVSLSANDRLHNVMGAFSANEKIVQTKNILLVDDVATTSSTMFACSHALLEAGAKSVYGLTLARAVNIKNTGNSTNG